MVSRVLDRLGGSVDNTGGKQSTPSMIAINIIEGVDCLPPVLSTEPPKRSNTRETMTEFVVADQVGRSVM
jgi:hypothetical protein